MTINEVPDTAVHIVATLTAIKGEEARLLQVLRELVSASQAEPGCMQYIPHVETAHSGTFVLYEVWASQAALDEHMATPHFLSFVAAAESLLSEPPHIRTMTLIQ